MLSRTLSQWNFFFTSSYLNISHLILFHFISFHLILSSPIFSYPIQFHFILSQLVSFQLIFSHFISSYLILLHLFLSYLILSHLIISHLILSYVISHHVIFSDLVFLCFLAWNLELFPNICSSISSLSSTHKCLTVESNSDVIGTTFCQSRYTERWVRCTWKQTSSRKQHSGLEKQLSYLLVMGVLMMN